MFNRPRWILRLNPPVAAQPISRRDGCNRRRRSSSAHGELDAANAQEFVDYALGHIACAPQLVLDLTGLRFFGTAGFFALHTLKGRGAGKNIQWVLVPSPMVTRRLRLCDPDSALPVSATVNATVGQLERKPPPLPQPVSKSR